MKVKINEVLAEQGKSKYWLSKQTGITAPTLTNLSNGKTTRISFDLLDKICSALNCTPNDILEPEPPTEK